MFPTNWRRVNELFRYAKMKDGAMRPPKRSIIILILTSIFAETPT